MLVHTDIMLDHLTDRRPGRSTLRRVMRSALCYTTVFNAIELFSLARTSRETEAVENTMSAMKILGLNAKNAKRFATLFGRATSLPRMNALIAGLAVESKLPILTDSHLEFRGVRGLRLLSSRDV